MVARYETLAKLGQGAGGEVFRAFDRERGHPVALKRLRAEGALERLRFGHEFFQLKRLDHPALVKAYDRGEDAEGPYYTMELVEGEAWPVGPLEPARATRLLAAACAGVGYLHQNGLVHGDLKPDNMRVTGPDTVKLLDLGFLQQAGRPGERRGTLEYMAPELLAGASADPRADVYALGTIAYALLSGRLPLEAAHPLAWVQAQLHQPPVPLATRVPGLDAALSADVMACLAKQAGDRPPTAAHLAARLAGSGLAADFLVFGGEAFGRAGALEALLTGVRAQLEGKAGTLALVGESGSGKTRLLAELATPDAAWALLRSGARGDLPYELLSELLTEAEALLLARGLEPSDEAWLPLRAFRPAWGQAPPPLEPSQQESRVREALAALLGRLGEGGRLVVAIDDFDQADSASRGLLTSFLGRTDGTAWVLTGRSAPREAQTSVALAPLDAVAVTRFAAAALCEAPPGELVEQLLASSQGNPAQLRALLEAWHAAGAIARRHGHWEWTPARAVQALPNQEAAARQAIAGISSAALALAQAAAVLGARGSLAQLAALTRQPPVEALDALDAAGLLRLEGERYAFVGAAREVLLQALEPEDAKALHLAAAALYEGSDDLQDVVRATRHRLAADPFHAGAAVLKAVRLCFEQGALAVAEELLGAIVVPTLTPRELQERARLTGDLARTRGEGAAALAAYDEAIALARASRDDMALTRELVSAGRVALSLSNPGRARANLEEALPLALSRSDAPQAVRALLTLARLAIFEGRPREARDHLDDALARTAAPGLEASRAAALSQLGTLGGPADPAARRALAEAARLHRALHNPVGWLDAAINLADRLLGAGELPAAEALLAEALATCRQVGAFAEETFVLLNLAQARIEAGRYAAARVAAEQAGRLATDLAMPFPAGYAQIFGGLAAAKTGDLAAGTSALAAAVAAATATGNRYLEAAAYLATAQVALDRGDSEAAAAPLKRGASLATSQGDPAMTARVAWLQARAGTLAGARPGLADEILQAADAARQAGAGLMAAQLELAWVRLAFEGPEMATALQRAQEVEAQAQAAGARELVAEAQWWQAEAARRAGDFAGAKAHFEAVLKYGEAAPVPLWQALAHVGLGRLGPSPEARRHASEGDRLMRAQQAASGTEAFWNWPERRLTATAAPDGAPGAGLAQTVAMFSDLRSAGSAAELGRRLLDRLLEAVQATKGAFLLYRDAQLDHFSAVGLPDAQVLENEAIDRALWERKAVVDEGGWALPLLDQDGEVTAIAYLEGAPTAAHSTARLVAEAAGEMVSHFRTLEHVQERVERLAFTQSIARLALQGHTREQILREALRSAIAITGADRAILLTAGAERVPSLLIGVDRTGRDLPANAPVSSSVCQHVLSSYEPVRLMDAQRLEGWQQQQSILALGLQTIVAVPVMSAGRATAVLYVDSANVLHLLGPREQSLLEAAAELLAPLLMAGDPKSG